ncbi:pentapeptide repeat-containing protein [Schaalia sp. Marseille-Q2122]|uniref:pentapeptide repeat-containing protein n=1 Tax=Schaalia sp. Marseille-Q2122 TaxID=2736604 RepID=UPI00158C7F32|nr:pentapeptide repeat-containing protein [Schaalia sp. Marseille-Q2122]
MNVSQGHDSGTWVSHQLNADKPREQKKQSRQASFWRTWPLLWVIATWVAIAFALFITVGLLIWWFFINDPQTPGAGLFVGEKGADPLKFVQTILAIVGGVGAVGYLVIKYRERSDAESSKADHRLLEAVTQLGSDSPQVRIAGVYALADIADTFQGSYKQRVVDILCGYLRTDRSDGGVQQSDTSSPIRFRDAAVESTVLSVIASHVRKDADSAKSWSECNFDIHGAVIHEHVPFTETIWKGVIQAESIQFLGNAVFTRASFSVGAIFGGASFSGAASFNGALFDGVAVFSEASFGGGADFSGASFGDWAVFRGASFGDWVDFSRVSFGDWTRFDEVAFGAGVSFSEARFGIRAFFSEASFAGEAGFSSVSFGDWAQFNEVSFGGGVDFNKASFADWAFFRGASFGDWVDFSRASFGENAFFAGVTFGCGVNFEGTRYGRGSLLTPIQQEWLRRENAEEQQDVQGEGATSSEPRNEFGVDNAEENDNAGPVADNTPGETGAADEKSTDNN